MCVVSYPAKAEFNWPLNATLPNHDLAVGLTGGVAYGEQGGQGAFGALGGVHVSYLHGVMGAELTLLTHPERTGVRLEVLTEMTVWYVFLIGVGVGLGDVIGASSMQPSDTVRPSV